MGTRQRMKDMDYRDGNLSAKGMNLYKDWKTLSKCLQPSLECRREIIREKHNYPYMVFPLRCAKKRKQLRVFKCNLKNVRTFEISHKQCSTTTVRMCLLNVRTMELPGIWLGRLWTTTFKQRWWLFELWSSLKFGLKSYDEERSSATAVRLNSGALLSLARKGHEQPHLNAVAGRLNFEALWFLACYLLSHGPFERKQWTVKRPLTVLKKKLQS